MTDSYDFGELERTIAMTATPTEWVLKLRQGQEIALSSEWVVLGRRPRTTGDGGHEQLVTIPDTTRTVSRSHAKLMRAGHEWLIEDLDSANGVIIGDKPDAGRIGIGVHPVTGRTFWLGDVAMAIEPRDTVQGDMTDDRAARNEPSKEQTSATGDPGVEARVLTYILTEGKKPTGRLVGEWLGKSPKSGQRFLAQMTAAGVIVSNADSGHQAADSGQATETGHATPEGDARVDSGHRAADGQAAPEGDARVDSGHRAADGQAAPEGDPATGTGHEAVDIGHATPASGHGLSVCGFCGATNPEHLALCRQCGVELRVPTRVTAEPVVSARTATPPPAEVAGVMTAPLPPVMTGGATPKKQRTGVLVTACVAACLLFIGAAWASVALLSSVTTSASVATQAPSPAVTVVPDGWDKSPTWLADVDGITDMSAVEGAVAYSDDRSVVVLDDRSGDPLASIMTDTPVKLRTDGTQFVAVADTELWTWRAGDDAWSAVAVESDAHILELGEAVFVVAADKKSVQVVQDDGRLEEVTIPATGATPVAADGDTLIWATAKQEVIVTDRVGENSAKSELTQPNGDATVSRWLGCAEGLVLVLWESGDELIVASHSADSGELADSLIAERTEGASLLVAGDRATALFGDVKVDLTTGAMSPLASPLADGRAIWQGIVGVQAGEPVLVTGTGVEQIGSGSVTNITAGTPSGAIIIATDGAIGMYPATARGE